MATINIRPVADVSLGHTCNSGSSGYSLLNETSADDATTYIYQNIDNTSSETVDSIFRLAKLKMSDLTITNGKDYVWITGIRLYFRCAASQTGATMSMSCSLRTESNGSDLITVSDTDIGNSWSTSNTDTYNGIYGKFDDSTMTQWYAHLQSSGHKSSSKATTTQLRCTQIYARVTYYMCWESQAISTEGVTASVNRPFFYDGGLVTFSAALDSGYAFVGWMTEENYQKWLNDDTSYSVVSTDLEYEINVDSDVTLYAVAYNTTPPVLSITSQDLPKISAQNTKTRCTVKFTADQHLTTFEARAQKTANADWSGRNGVIVETGEPLEVGDEGLVYVDYNELSNGDGQYDIKIFGPNRGGVWSE